LTVRHAFIILEYSVKLHESPRTIARSAATILPPNPSDAIKGTELIRLVRLRLKDEYSDATLRYHFSILCYDPGSPIAKVDQGQGYYLRLNKPEIVNGSGRGLFDSRDSTADLSRARLGRFSAIVERHSLHGSRYPLPWRNGPQVTGNCPISSSRSGITPRTRRIRSVWMSR